LALRSHVIVENFKLGTMERWSLSYQNLAPRNPGLIYCSISGYGRTGPDASLPGYDYVMQGVGGIMSITGEPDGPPGKVGVAIVDLTAGMFALSSILAALRVRDLTGQGQRIDLSLLDSHLAWLANVAGNYLVSGDIPRRYGNAHPNIVPYQAFEASDAWFILAIGNDRQWSRFCAAVARPDLTSDTRFTTNADRVRNRSALVPILTSLFRAHPRSHWLTLLQSAGIPTGPVNTVDLALTGPQVEARGMVQTIDHPGIGPFRTVASPLNLESTPPTIRRHPPMLGEHTAEILRELSISGEAQL
jgi:formyl-CoA transferase